MEGLIAKLKRRDKNAFKEIMKLYKNMIFNYINLMINNRELAEELTQETFVRVYFKAHTLKSDNPKAWIYKIATNLTLKELKKRRLKRLLPFSEWRNSNHYYTKDDSKILINELLKDIPEKYKTPIIMKEIEELSFEEISDILNKPVGTVKSLVFRGKQLLKDNYNKFNGGSND
jgi:RNA polymerase sigma-70 factor (ECF subfamily)